MKNNVVVDVDDDDDDDVGIYVNHLNYFIFNMHILNKQSISSEKKERPIKNFVFKRICR